VPAESKNIYFCYHSRYGTDPFTTHVVSIASTSGSQLIFNGSERDRGEPVNIAYNDGTFGNGWVTFIGDGFVSIDTTSANSIKMPSAVITGTVSGGVIVCGTNYSNSNSTKYFRCHHGGVNENNRSSFVKGHASNGNMDYDTRTDGVLNNHQSLDVNGSRCNVGSWDFYETEIICDQNNNFRIENRVNGQVWSVTENAPAVFGTEAGLRLTLIGLDLGGTGDVPSEVLGTSQDLDSIAWGTDVRRVIMTNNEIYSDSTVFELQPYFSWDRYKIDFVAAYSDWPENNGKYLHIFNRFGDSEVVLWQ
jgi:hypothetical protein